ncbi:MAG: IS66 family insertion sequence element accessory protein TnpB [Aliidiomarina sp.]|uniref:IS66 family insertion sequence element accessory protein TnpA n=1 Tax=Aliidiomarina sp. TaxID=1872439 RepID=UPI0025BC76C8|nr:IS66 family insertion sequence element accessory protein TnpB [Aliidiomarina sp.]MCH8501602.1 IS66 family insertion sequence element accessory protein TnpB [Aliidiomarina sp.]
MSRLHRTPEQWRALIAEFEQSDLSQKDFCEQRGINPAYFSQRRLELQRDAEDNDMGFALAMPQSHASQQTLQLRIGQTELVLPLSASPRWVAQLVKELSA